MVSKLEHAEDFEHTYGTLRHASENARPATIREKAVGSSALQSHLDMCSKSSDAASEMSSCKEDDGQLNANEYSSPDMSPRTRAYPSACVGSQPASAQVLSKPTIHWKNGYTLDRDGQRRDLTPNELDNMRRERNRLHAKMTRDRKKLYIETLSRAVSNLEDENRRVRDALNLQLNACKQEPDCYLRRLGVERISTSDP